MLKKLAFLALVLGLAFGAMMLAARSATFVCSRSLVVHDSPAAVWHAATDVGQWPQWGPGVLRSKLTAGWRMGGTLELELQGRPERNPARIEAVVPERELAWVRPGVLGSVTRTTVRVEPVAGGTKVTLESSIRGPQAFLGRFTGREVFDGCHEAVLSGLQARLETRGKGESHAGN